MSLLASQNHCTHITAIQSSSKRHSECYIHQVTSCLHVLIDRYADVLVHRLLAVSIGADASYPDLLDKNKTQVNLVPTADNTVPTADYTWSVVMG